MAVSIALSTLPAVAYFVYLAEDNWLWAVKGRVSALTLLVVPIAMATYTLWVVAIKWLLTGRRANKDFCQVRALSHGLVQLRLMS